MDSTIDQLELTPHRKKLAMRLSGGMKRKLCVAIALIGDPDVVLLDEPSAGLDPVSRRNLWSVILRTMSQRAVVLTTHSMDEAEALCRRIGIMVKGQLRALGTKQHLKSKFGSGYELEMKVHITDLVKQSADISNFVMAMFPAATLISENGGLFTFRIPKEEAKMGLAFSELEKNKENLAIETYSLAQPTLEQVGDSFFFLLISPVQRTINIFFRYSFAPSTITPQRREARRQRLIGFPSPMRKKAPSKPRNRSMKVINTVVHELIALLSISIIT